MFAIHLGYEWELGFLHITERLNKEQYVRSVIPLFAFDVLNY